jgi:4-hydroxybenzoate polyprenyltransferase
VNRLTGLLILSYVTLQFGYAVWLKHTAIMDLMCIAMGFVLRVLVGSAAVSVSATHWLLICTFLLALFLGIGKRRQEANLLGQASAAHRPVLVNYSMGWLDHAATMLSSATIIAYALYTVAPDTQTRFGSDRLVYTVPFVVYGILRYLHMMHTDGTAGDPTNSLLADRPLLICVSGWALACVALVYL